MYTRRQFFPAAIIAAGVSTATSTLVSCRKAQTDGSATFLAILPIENLTFVPDLVASTGRLFDDHGIDVIFQTTRGSPQAIQLILARQATLTRIGQIEAMRVCANQSAPIVGVGTVLRESTIRFVSSATRPIMQPSDFEGTTVGIPSRGGTTETTLDLMLASARIDPARVARQVVGLTTSTFALVEQRRLSSYAVTVDTSHLLRSMGAKVAILRPSNFISAGAQFYMAARHRLAENAESVRRYLAAIRDAIEFIIADYGFENTLSLLRQRYSFSSLLDTDVARATLAEYAESWTRTGPDNVLTTYKDSWQGAYDELVDTDLINPGLDPAACYTNDLLS